MILGKSITTILCLLSLFFTRFDQRDDLGQVDYAKVDDNERYDHVHIPIRVRDQIIHRLHKRHGSEQGIHIIDLYDLARGIGERVSHTIAVDRKVDKMNEGVYSHR